MLAQKPWHGQNSSMMFLIFIAVVFALGLFHRWEHRVMIADLKQVLPLLKTGAAEITAAQDWRLISQAEGYWTLRRAFHVPDRTAALRYAMPVLLAATMMIGLANIPMGIGYAVFCVTKWFGTDIQIKTAPLAEYAVQCAGIKIFGEPLESAPAE